jgi:phosphoribosylglycinamide formyltransferase-1
MRITVLISGRGSNMIALCKGATDYSVGAVLSDNSEAEGLAWAREQGIATRCVLREKKLPKEVFHKELLREVEATAPDLVVLAGFMVILPSAFVAAYPSKIVNIHPSLLPRHPGLNTHARALAEGDTHHGCTVHLVDEGIDSGPMLAQARIPIHSDDTATTLAERTLLEEHRLYSWVINAMARGEIRAERQRIIYSEKITQIAAEVGFVLSTPR